MSMEAHDDSITRQEAGDIERYLTPSRQLRKAVLCVVAMRAILQFSSRRVSSFVLHGSRHKPNSFAGFARAAAPTSRRIQVTCFSTKDPNRGNEKKSNKSKKWKINPNITQANLDKLVAAFDDMARKEGFDDSTAYYADDATFEDDFDSDKYNDALDTNLELNPDDFNLSDFEVEDDDDDFGSDENDDGSEQSMEARIAAAKRDMDLGRISVPKELDSLARDVSQTDLRRLGFKREANPFGNDETPRKEQFMLISNAMSCSACGADFQCSNEQRPGYIPPDKFATQVKLSKIEDLQKLQEKAETSDWSPEDEIEYLIQTSKEEGTHDDKDVVDIDIDAIVEEMDLDLVELAGKKVICKRCHGLQNFGKVEQSLRPGWTEEPMLSQDKFRDLLRPIREKPAVIIALVDLFDFSGSVLPELDAIAGDNPVILAANKADLLPSEMGQARAESWVRRELEYLGIKSIANIGGAVRLVSCKTGFGIDGMLSKARRLADDMDCDVYIVGAANAGKSTLINKILEDKAEASEKRGKVRAGNANKLKGAVTTSPLPGTTLKFIRIDIGEGKSLYDTPGLLVNGTLTQLLTPEELKMAVPKK